MKYGIVENHKFILIDENRQRLENTIPFMPGLKETDIVSYEDSEIEQGHDGVWYEKGFAPVVPDDVKLEKAKAERAKAVAAITVEVDGMVFDGDETAQARMARAITMFQASSLPDDYTTAWVLEDNTVAQVTVSQLAQALLLAGQKQTELWTKPYEKDGTNG
ncbi:DUF4376 domain-containing protein [Oxalobacter aliiformigenes]|uniref:DUF4376 domain-containing protein n=1 Tax=Oxalobacter aliiformigenes TaxID=2946593 RepID=UPI0022AE853D|nr:DUF4376 domain-containing protein [Oxalobacter aliiformigenes]MCZ4065730.1 DUF4376 domain-containing protein [Oxalobacter aliiformigenes]WAV98638.1 DUF4376 domain-containing protein [Oxalobacter aliiformigenes]